MNTQIIIPNNNVMNTEKTNTFSLEKLRKRLLDLSALNRLLAYSHSRYSNSIRVVDELPDQLHEVLMSEEEFRFDPVPEPTRKEFAEFVMKQEEFIRPILFAMWDRNNEKVDEIIWKLVKPQYSKPFWQKEIES